MMSDIALSSNDGKDQGTHWRKYLNFKVGHAFFAASILPVHSNHNSSIMKSILSAIAIFATSFALMSCGGKGDAETEVSAKTHADISQGVVSVMTEMMTEMSKVNDVASAEAFAAKMPEVKTQMKAYLEAAQKLSAPTAEEKAAFDKAMNDAQEKAGPAMMAMMMGMSQNPEAEAIGKVLEGVMEDEDMDQVVETLEGIYKVEEAEAPSAE